MSRITFVRSLAAVALAAIPATVEAKGVAYDCDTAGDRFSELRLPVASSAFEVTGKIRTVTFAQNTKYLPLARIQIASGSDPDQPPDAFAGLALIVLRSSEMADPAAPALEMLSFSERGKKDEPLTMESARPVGEVRPFALAFDGSRVTVTVGGETRSYPLKTGDPVVRMVCSTGEFLFTDVTVTPSR